MMRWKWEEMKRGVMSSINEIRSNSLRANGWCLIKSIRRRRIGEYIQWNIWCSGGIWTWWDQRNW